MTTTPVEYRTNSALNRDEGFLHYVAREGRVALRWVMGVCMALIVLFMVSPGFFFVAVLPAIVLLAAAILYYAASVVEARSDREAHEVVERHEVAVVGDVVEDHTEDDQLAPQEAQLVKRESTIALIMIGCALTAAIIVAMFLLPWHVTLLGVFLLFAYIIFISAPFWLGWFNNDIEDESRRLEGKPQSARVKTE
jgi:membrane protein implicated in regulation of membrane protease activity